MKEAQHIDPERLAALLDGRLGSAEAAAVRQQLAAADDDTLAAYADAIAVSAELGGAASSDSLAGVIPIQSGRRRRRWVGAVVAIAAAAVVAVFVYRSPATTDAYPPAMYASAVPASATLLAEQGWSATRGASDGMSDRARAVRTGALLTDLELDAIRRDTTKAHAMALVALLGSNEGGGPIKLLLQQIVNAGNTAPSLRLVHQIGQQALTLVDRKFADAGAYLEAARIAMLNGDSTFVDRVPPMALLQLKSDTGLDASQHDALRHFEVDLGKRPLDVAPMTGQLTSLLRILAQ